MKLKNFKDGELTFTFTVEELKCFAQFLHASTSVIVDYRNGVLESDFDEFKARFDDLDALSRGYSFEIRHFIADLANML